jgi:phospholipid-binding lipoprotein MlaA
MKMSLLLRLAGAVSVAVMLSACSAAPTQTKLQPATTTADDAEFDSTAESVNDPIEGFNRAMFQVNYALDRVIGRPFTWLYTRVTPDFARTGVHNMLDNWYSPVSVINSALQGKFMQAANTTWRFIINSTIGLLGFADVAGEAGLRAPVEDFGQTLGHWGAASGPYLVLPVFGPSSVRDAAGLVGDIGLDPFTYYMQTDDLIARGVARGLDTRVIADKVLEEIYGSVDPYVTMRSLYLQRRTRQLAE